MENKEIPIKINQIIKSAVVKFGKEGDPIIKYKGFIIFLKSRDKVTFKLNEIIKVKIVKILSKSAEGRVVR